MSNRVGRRIGLLAFIGLQFLAAPSKADTIYEINFDNLVPLTPVTDQYASWGVQFSAHLLNAQPEMVVAGGALAQSQPNVLACAYSFTDGAIAFSFTPGASSVSFTAVSAEDGVTARYYDASGSLLFSDVRAATATFTTPVAFSYANSGHPVRTVVLESRPGGVADSFAIDNVIYALLPEPSTILLLGLALPLAVRRR